MLTLCGFLEFRQMFPDANYIRAMQAQQAAAQYAYMSGQPQYGPRY